MTTTPQIRLVDLSKHRELAAVQDVRLAARALAEAALRYQTMPWYPECEPIRAELKRQYDRAIAEMLEALNV